MIPVINRNISDRYVVTMLAVVSVTLLLSACTAPKAPELSINTARESILNAERAGASQHAWAELENAKQKLMWAEEAVSDNKVSKAKRLAQESYIFAELAMARTEFRQVVQMSNRVDGLLDGMQRVVRE
ncbi:DUF4398 domain-containing protein [Salinispirillum sp. LH 10-3-1]|uniref:DUF4398 domain-containing protein n=1 Tax=Salinispirillum sp. LH 10-3-1 TaxID=2952525 RepID=A0AB38YL54_9GAMM